jgi:hypothetical protein
MEQLVLFPEPKAAPEPVFICYRTVKRFMARAERDMEVQEYVRDVRQGLFLYSTSRLSALAATKCEWDRYLMLPSKVWELEEVALDWNIANAITKMRPRAFPESYY